MPEHFDPLYLRLAKHAYANPQNPKHYFARQGEEKYQLENTYNCSIVSFPAVCALVGCVMMGPRIGRFDKDGKSITMPGHSAPLAGLGGLILVFGFFACNGTKQVEYNSKRKKSSIF